jgi:hypothetical protein
LGKCRFGDGPRFTATADPSGHAHTLTARDLRPTQFPKLADKRIHHEPLSTKLHVTGKRSNGERAPGFIGEGVIVSRLAAVCQHPTCNNCALEHTVTVV